MSANDELQAHTCEKMIEFYGNQSKTSKNRMLEIKNTSKEISDLTEQWKNGELERGWYYIKKLLKDRVVMDFYYGNDVDRWMDNYDEEIKEVLAPVPSYEEWQYLLLDNKILKQCQEIDFGTAYTETVKTKAENQQLKKLLKECKTIIHESILGEYVIELCERITDAIGEKK